MDLAYRQMRNEALLMLQSRRLRTELKRPPIILETAPLTGEGLAALRACLTNQKLKPTI